MSSHHHEWTAPYRGKGRTTKMLIDVAEELKTPGSYVFVVCIMEHVKGLIDRLVLMVELQQVVFNPPGTVKVYTKNGSQVSFHSIYDEQADIVHGLMRGMHTSCKMFMDHYALERFLPWAMEQWHKYSIPEK